MPNTYTFADVMRLTGATKSHLTHWLKEGIIDAAVSPGAGPGYHRRFSFFNLVEAAIALEMNRLGAPAYAVKNIVSYVRWLEKKGSRDAKEPWEHTKQEMADVAALFRERVLSRAVRVRGSKRRTNLLKREVQEFVEIGERFYEDAKRDARAWFYFRVPQWRDQHFEWVGITYSFRAGAAFVPEELADAGGIVVTSLIVVPKDENVSISWFGRSAVLVDLRGVLQELEAKTGESLAGVAP
jgi:hypothetical protein